MADIKRPLRAELLDQLTWHYWGKADIYTGPTGTGQWVPRVGDKVWDGLRDYRVAFIDPVTLLSELVPITSKSGGVDEEDVLVTTGPNSYSEAFRLYVDDRTVPQTMAADVRLRLYGTSVRYVKVFKGTDISNNGHVISGMYNASGVKISENIPTELLVMPNANNLGVQTMQLGYCTDTINDGELATLVTYTSDGIPVSWMSMIMVNTSFVRTVDSSKAYITNIELISDFLDPADTTLLRYPLNMVNQSDSYYVRVRYSSGVVSDPILVDGNKVSLIGIDSFIASQVGQLTKLKLTYTLAADEYATDTSAPLPNRVIQRDYRLLTTESDNTYSVKLYMVPRWNAASAAWELTYWLYDLQRGILEDVTARIEVGATSAAFNGTNYSTPQELVVAFNMSNLGPSYAYYRYVQSFTITLFGPGSNRNANEYWNIKYSSDLNYGNGLLAHVSTDNVPGNYRIDISNGFSTLHEWLRRMYWALSPLYLPSKEEAAPEPTHVRIRIGTVWVREIPIDKVLEPIAEVNTAIVHGQAIRLEYINRTSNTDLELAMGSLTARL